LITITNTEIFPQENHVQIELSNGKKYKILLRDYENLPFECAIDSPLENITIDVGKIELSETNQYFNGDCVRFLSFLSRKYSIYKSAIYKVALSDIPKKVLAVKLYFSYERYYKKLNQNRNKNNKIEIEPETLKTLCNLVCDEFEASGYIDDRRYALDKAKYLKEYKKYGNKKIKEYLYAKRISSDIIGEILEDELFADVQTETENMRALLIKKYGENLNRLDKSDRKDIQKAFNMLIRSGYKYQDAKNAIADFIDELDIDP